MIPEVVPEWLYNLWMAERIDFFKTSQAELYENMMYFAKGVGCGKRPNYFKTGKGKWVKV